MGRHPQYTYVWQPAPPRRTTRRRLRLVVMEWFPVLAVLLFALTILGLAFQITS